MLEVFSILTIVTAEIKQGATSELILGRHFPFYSLLYKKGFTAKAARHIGDCGTDLPRRYSRVG